MPFLLPNQQRQSPSPIHNHYTTTPYRIHTKQNIHPWSAKQKYIRRFHDSGAVLLPVDSSLSSLSLVTVPPTDGLYHHISTQPCIPPGSLDQVPVLTGWGKGKNVTSVGWQVTPSDGKWVPVVVRARYILIYPVYLSVYLDIISYHTCQGFPTHLQQ